MRSKGLIPALAAAALLFAVQSRADGSIPAGARNIATTSGTKSCTYENLNTYNSLFNGVKDRWLGLKPKPATDYYPSETVTFLETRPVVNAYRVLRGNANSGDRKQVRQATTWEFYGSNDGGVTLTLLHAQTEPVQWYDGTTPIIDNVDCVFDNTTPYSTYKFRVTGNGGDSYAAIDDVELYCLERTDTLTIANNGFDVGSPTPAYGVVTGLAPGDEVRLSVADTRVVNPATSRRYELTGFTITDFDGTVLHDGTPDELPYTYVHGTRATTVTWNWSDPLAEYIAVHRTDLTSPENANLNEISDGMMDGSPVTYYNGGARADNGPQFLFDGTATQSSRWFLGCAAPFYAQYVFKENTAEVRRSVTGLRLVTNSSPQGARQLRGFDFEGSNDGTSWTTLLSLSVSSPEKITSNSWDLDNTDSYSRYRFVARETDGKNLEIYELEFYGYRGADVLEIRGTPAYGQPEPDYGITEGLAAGRALTLTAPTDEIVVSEDEKSVCTGYVLATEGSDPVTNIGTSCSYVHSGRGTVCTWVFSSTYRQRVGVRGSGSVDCEDDFFAAGGTALTITATPASADEPFLEWQGDVPEGQANNPVLRFTVDRPRSLTAVFAAPTYVSATGDDANDGSSWEKAVRTVSRAWEISGGAGKICLGEGEFEVKPGVVNVAQSLQLIGLGPDKSVLVADNSEGSGTVLTVGNERAVVTGVHIKGGVIESGTGAGLVLTAGTVTNCWIEGCSSPGNAGGAWLNGTGLLVDSVVTNCTAGEKAGGVYVTKGTFRRNMVTDCRAVSVGGAYFASATTVADAVFRGNASTGIGTYDNGGAIGCGEENILFTNCVFEANSASHYSGVIDRCPASVVFEDCLFARNTAAGRDGVGDHFYGTIRRSRLVGNSGFGEYGGTLCLDANGKMENCLVTGGSGGGCVIYCNEKTIIENCTIVSNRCTSAGAVNFGDRVRSNEESWVRNSVFAENYSGTGDDLVLSNWTGSAFLAVHCCIPGHDPSVLGEGSITNAPLFTDAARGDYTFGWKSPCVNAGDNSYVQAGEVDLLGNPRIHRFGGRAKHEIVDMGCYESPFRRTKGLSILVH